MKEIAMILVDHLIHHPENPRKDLGDLKELKESIKKNGVMQNLTVVPAEESGKYLVVIGNRRLEAAKEAGLTELPCVISDMDHKTQISTMLMENMQRQDLTVYEQAQGFQMMMDLGFTAKEIGEKTGFSEKTVKDRIKFTKFNQKNFKDAVSNGATLADMIDISRLESKSEQNEAMKAAGTNNFRQVLNRLLGEQRYRKECETLAKMAEAAGISPLPENACTWRDYTYLNERFKVKEKEETTRKKLAKLGKEEGMFYGMSRDWSTNEATMTVYRKDKEKEAKEATDEEKEQKERERKRQKHLREVKKLWAEAYQLRTDFVRNYTVTNGFGMTTIGKLILKYSMTQQNAWNGALPERHDWKEKYIRETLEIKPEEYEDKKSLMELAEARGIPQIRLTLAWMMGGGVFDCDTPESGLYYYYDGTYREEADSTLKRRYEFLQEIGYVMSDMEAQLMDGTHPINAESQE